MGFFLSILFISALAEEIRQFCMTDPRSTTFAVVTNDQIVKVGFMHHRGAEFAPIHNGLITLHEF